MRCFHDHGFFLFKTDLIILVLMLVLMLLAVVELIIGAANVQTTEECFGYGTEK